jgi:drug/metabolite transporter (DMT)-like permease
MQARRSPGWADIVGSVLLVLAVSVPTMILEEDWHGRPMIDQPTHLWILAACLVAGAFFAGGAVVAFRRPSAPTRSAVATGVLAVGILLIGAMYRRRWVAHEFIPRDVKLLWLAGVIAAITMTLAGSVLGRQLTR